MFATGINGEIIHNKRKISEKNYDELMRTKQLDVSKLEAIPLEMRPKADVNMYSAELKANYGNVLYVEAFKVSILI